MAEMKKQNDQNQGQGQNVAVRQGQPGAQGQRGQQGLARQQNRGDLMYRNPFQLMRDLVRDPFGTMVPFQSEFSPQMEVRETNDAFIFKADLPGVRSEDLDINVHGNRLQISGHREDEHEERDGDRVYAYERSYGNFTRVFTLPETADTDKIRCDLKEGVLSLVVPKKPGAQPRKIQIGGGGKS
jgi:HSP20 family protein